MKEKQMKGKSMKMKNIGNKRNNTNSTCCNDNNISNTCNSKYKCSVWRGRFNKKSRASEEYTGTRKSKRKANNEIRGIFNRYT